MKTTQIQHPAKAFGAWIKSVRQSKGFIARIFAGQVWLSPSKYAEVEVGVVRWIGEKQEIIIPILLELVDTQREEFHTLLRKARAAVALAFENIFNRNDLKPVRLAHSQGKQITIEEEKALLEVVFQPLAA